jgi:hypothetical protein
MPSRPETRSVSGSDGEDDEFVRRGGGVFVSVAALVFVGCGGVPRSLLLCEVDDCPEGRTCGDAAGERSGEPCADSAVGDAAAALSPPPARGAARDLSTDDDCADDLAVDDLGAGDRTVDEVVDRARAADERVADDRGAACTWPVSPFDDENGRIALCCCPSPLNTLARTRPSNATRQDRKAIGRILRSRRAAAGRRAWRAVLFLLIQDIAS